MVENKIKATMNGRWILKGIQLRERILTPKWFGKMIIWIFFHREDTSTEVALTGFNE